MHTRKTYSSICVAARRQGPRDAVPSRARARRRPAAAAARAAARRRGRDRRRGAPACPATGARRAPRARGPGRVAGGGAATCVAGGGTGAPVSSPGVTTGERARTPTTRPRVLAVAVAERLRERGGGPGAPERPLPHFFNKSAPRVRELGVVGIGAGVVQRPERGAQRPGLVDAPRFSFDRAEVVLVDALGRVAFSHVPLLQLGEAVGESAARAAVLREPSDPRQRSRGGTADPVAPRYCHRARAGARTRPGVAGTTARGRPRL